MEVEANGAIRAVHEAGRLTGADKPIITALIIRFYLGLHAIYVDRIICYRFAVVPSTFDLRQVLVRSALINSAPVPDARQAWNE